MTGHECECVWDAAASLGEGPVWDEREGAVYWVDIEAPAILRYEIDGGGRTVYPMPEKIGCIALRAGGGLSAGLVAGLQSGFAFVDLDGTGERAQRPTVRAITDPEGDQPGNRFNDGKCDGGGRLWAGTMDDAIVQPTGALYRLDPDLSVHRMDDGYVVTNGPAWSPDGRTLYHNDTTARTVFAFDCDPVTGEITGKREFLRIPDANGYPDGLTVDCEGYIWLAHWDGWRVTRFTPEGTVDRIVRVPAAQVTSCTFGGADLRTLYVTTASTGLGDDQRAEQPLAGGLFAVELDVAGLPTNRFGG